MAGAKKNESGNGVGWILFPLLCVNAYAGWQLFRAAEHGAVKLFSSMTDSLTQLAIILIINTVVILVMALLKP